ncbi:hypothetical protein [Acetomicrobium sp.]|uniref:hypothetical protein n=1 Tax=Acetomicrobium sp. TaxID=1872099 RepID=UPI002FCA9539
MTGSESPLINISDESTFFSFDPGLTPIAEVEQNVLVKIETKDCFSNQITSEEQLIMDIDFSRINPATGPVFIKGAKKGRCFSRQNSQDRSKTARGNSYHTGRRFPGG